MTAQQITAVATSVLQLEQAGLIVIGGVKALVSILHTPPSEAELNALVDAVVSDATSRKAARDGM